MEPTIVATQHIEPYARLAPSRLHQEFQGKSVLVTGGGYGIGASIARSFAEAGVAAVTVTGRTESSLKGTAEELSKAYPAVKVSYQVVDIASEASVTRFFGSLSDSPDVLVNNAGFLSKPESFLDAEIGEWWKSFEINVLGTVRVSQAYLRHRKSKSPNSPGVVIALNTFGAYSIRAPNLTAYSASKIALARVFEMVSTDVPESVARFISVNPGAVRTAMYDKSGLEGAADIPTTNAQLSAEFIVWAASEEASFLSGRFVWANWDVDELIAKKKDIVEQDLLISGLRGF